MTEPSEHNQTKADQTRLTHNTTSSQQVACVAGKTITRNTPIAASWGDRRQWLRQTSKLCHGT